jgi:general secretion pathway protein F
MPAFAYRALIPASGAMEQGTLDAPGADEAARLLEQRGLLPVSIVEGAERRNLLQALGESWGGPGPAAVTMFLTDLALLTRASIRIDEALTLLERDFETGAMKPVIRKLRVALAGGRSFSEALAAFPALFPGFQVAMVRIAEASGRLPAILGRIADERARFERLSAKVTDALRYPAFLFLGTLGVTVFFLIAVIPQFEPIVRQSASVDPLLSGAFAVSRFVRENAALSAGFLVAAGAGLAWAMRSPALAGSIRRAFGRFPGLAPVVQSYRAARFARMFGIMAEAGVPAPQALTMIGEALSPDGSDPRAGQAADAVRQGARLAEALRVMNLPDLSVRMIKLGEETGELAPMAFQAADYYEARLDRQLSGVAGVAGPAAVLTISLLIGGMIVSVMTALMSINDMVR